MILAFVSLVGLFLGSFVNALVWRVHEQAEGLTDTRKGAKKRSPKPPTLSPSDLSILKGRSMCPHCRHALAPRDLVPVFSWLLLRGKCRYCKEPISWQYPAVELATSLLFAVSYLFWPMAWNNIGILNFVVWLILLVGFMALIVYDFRWMLLPNRVVYPLTVLVGVLAVINVIGGMHSLLETALSVLIAGGMFYVLFIFSKGKWIGGGDVKLGFLIGLVLGDPYLAFLMLFGASVLGSIIVLPGLLVGKVSAKSRIPFGPFLIVSAIIVQLFGSSIVAWYKDLVFVAM